MNVHMNRSPFRSFIIGADTKIPVESGNFITGINFDNAATTPPFYSVLETIVSFCPWYSSIHRGVGYKSQFSSYTYELCRKKVAHFVGADLNHDTVIFVKNTTEAINKLSYRLCCASNKKVVLSSCMEHHSNDLPWRDQYIVDYIDIDDSGRLSIKDLENKLKKYKNQVALVAITGCSNVTGYKNPIHKIAKLTHQYGSKIFVDGAQLIPHAPFHMYPSCVLEHIDYVAFSAHKMYAPFGIGVLIGPKSTFEKGAPDYKGGGTVDIVTHNFIRWADPPFKEEAGTPNIIGALALTTALSTLEYLNLNHIEEYEKNLTEYAYKQLKKIPQVKIYGDLKDKDRISILSFNICDMPHEIVATILSSEGGIAVRSGCFCAQPYIQRLLHLSPQDIENRIHNPSLRHPGMVRISFGLYNDYQEIDAFIRLIHKIIKNKPYYLLKYDPKRTAHFVTF